MMRRRNPPWGLLAIALLLTTAGVSRASPSHSVTGLGDSALDGPNLRRAIAEAEGGFFAITLDVGASGWEVKENEFSGVLIYEVFLEGGTTGNRVVVPQGTRVVDFGSGNEIVFE